MNSPPCSHLSLSLYIYVYIYINNLTTWYSVFHYTKRNSEITSICVEVRTSGSVWKHLGACGSVWDRLGRWGGGVRGCVAPASFRISLSIVFKTCLQTVRPNGDVLECWSDSGPPVGKSWSRPPQDPISWEEATSPSPLPVHANFKQHHVFSALH